MKLLLVSPCNGGYGGIEAFVFAVAEAVRREPGFEVRVRLKRTKDFILQPQLKQIVKREPDTDFCDRAGGELAAEIAWADIVHLQNASPDVVFLATTRRKPLVLTIHNYMAQGLTPHRLLWRIAAKLADARWYNSQFVWNTWEPGAKSPRSRKVPTVSKLPSGWTAPNERRGFAFVSRWIANKGADTLLDAYALARIDRAEWPLVMMGEGPLLPLIEYAIRKREIAGVEVLGFVDETTKAERISRARWMVVPPNTKEDFGLTAIEARSLGVPCIITRDGGLPEAGGQQALVCEPGDPAALARLLEQAAAMPQTEYEERASRTRDELASELEPMDFYARAYRQVLRGEPVT